MKNHYSIISLTILFVFFISSLSAQTMYINKKGGENKSYDVNNVSKMTFSTGNMNIVKTDKSIDIYALSSLQFVNFGDFNTAVQAINGFNNKLIVFPNPVNDMLNIKNISSNGSTLVITSLEGKQILTKNLNAIGNANVDVSQLPQGFYLCKLYDGTNVLTTKFLKQ